MKTVLGLERKFRVGRVTGNKQFDFGLSKSRRRRGRFSPPVVFFFSSLSLRLGSLVREISMMAALTQWRKAGCILCVVVFPVCEMNIIQSFSTYNCCISNACVSDKFNEIAVSANCSSDM